MYYEKASRFSPYTKHPLDDILKNLEPKATPKPNPSKQNKSNTIVAEREIRIQELPFKKVCMFDSMSAKELEEMFVRNRSLIEQASAR